MNRVKCPLPYLKSEMVHECGIKKNILLSINSKSMFAHILNWSILLEHHFFTCPIKVYEKSSDVIDIFDLM